MQEGCAQVRISRLLWGVWKVFLTLEPGFSLWKLLSWDAECFPSACIEGPLWHLAEFHTTLFSLHLRPCLALAHSQSEGGQMVWPRALQNALAALLCQQGLCSRVHLWGIRERKGSLQDFIFIGLMRNACEGLISKHTSAFSSIRFLHFPFALKTPLPFLGNEERLEINLIVIYLTVSGHAACSSLLSPYIFSVPF